MLGINLPYESEIPLVGIYPKDMKKIRLHKGLYANVHRSINYHDQKIIQMSMN